MKKIIPLIFLAPLFLAIPVFASTDISVYPLWQVYTNNVSPKVGEAVNLEFTSGGKGGRLVYRFVPSSGCSYSPDKLYYDTNTFTYSTTKLTCTTAGEKPISIIGDPSYPEEKPFQIAVLTFQPLPTTTKYIITTTTKVTTTTTTVPKPTPPSILSLKVGERKIAKEQLNSQEKVIFKASERKVFSGTAIPNGIVRLYFNSDPFEDTVTADNEGNWTYELEKDLGDGNHTLALAVEDPNTKEISTKSEPISFTIEKDQEQEIAASEADDKEPSNFFPYLTLIGFLLVVFIAGVTFMILRKKKAGMIS